MSGGAWAFAQTSTGEAAHPASPAPLRSPAATQPAPSGGADPSAQMPDAWLAWITGSLPPGTETRAAATPPLGTTVVIAGDTRWMTASHDGDGKVVGLF